MKFLVITFFLFICFSLPAKQKNRMINNSRFAEIIGTNKPDVKYIPPPPEFYSKSSSSGNGKIIVNYNNFSYYPRKSFQYAVSIIESVLNFEDTIIIDAYWKELSGTTLGSCGPTYFYKNYDGFTYPDVYYPSPLAEKLSPTKLKDENNFPDMIASFNSTANWYTKTDGNCPVDKYDLPSVILHEICHGLGISGNFSYINGIGSYGFGIDAPVIFDKFIHFKNNGTYNQVIQYENNSKEMGDILTSNNIFFKGPVTSNKISTPIKLYSPSKFNPGSSIYHIVFPFGDNDLMRFSTGYGAVIHDPGPVVKAIFAEMGWSAININHNEIKNDEEINDILIEAKITSDFETDIINPTLFYSIDSSEYLSTPMILINSVDYQATIPISESAHVSYYLSVSDKYNRNYNLPTVVPDNSFSFYIGKDTISPIIEHMPISFLLPEQDSIAINAKITDDFGIRSAIVSYQINNSGWKEHPLTYSDNENYNAIVGLSEPLKENDIFEYKITAIDSSSSKNMTILPIENIYSITVEPIPDYITSYETNFDLPPYDFMLQGFNIKKAPEFNNAALHTEHPYKFAGEDNFIDYIAQLRYPIKISEDNHFLKFDQIVLVEPGEPNTVFGDDEFWDYVIVEASKDNGKTWHELEHGWDSRIHKEWEDSYNKGLFQNNSQTVAQPNMYKSHLIDLISSDHFNTDDIIIIRFRLYSDPYAYGWGWVIDNIEIQTPKLSSTTVAHNINATVFPNPVNDNVIYISTNNTNLPIDIIIYNMNGQAVFKKENILNQSPIHLPSHINGVYIVKLMTKNGNSNIKLIVQ